MTPQSPDSEIKPVPVPEMQSAVVRRRYPHLSYLCDIIEHKEALYVNRKVGGRPRWVKLFDVPAERTGLEQEVGTIFISIAELERRLRIRDDELRRVYESRDGVRFQLQQVGRDVADLQNKYNSMRFWDRLKWAFNPK